MKTIRIILISIVVYVCGILAVNAQQDTVVNKIDDVIEYINNEPGRGNVKIIQDKRIDKLLQKSIKYDSRYLKIKGYRVRIFSNNSQGAKEMAYNNKLVFEGLFPDIPVYVVPNMPNWNVYVGDYRTKDDAIRDLKLIQEYYPNAFLKPDNIRFPKL
ncbi:MAG: SPOR domain-containing protein [Bacteroidales bacterium]|jgi:hypothetical protein|nr:SPOR domain-containing protein [Bacteroidales bacterium]